MCVGVSETSLRERISHSQPHKCQTQYFIVVPAWDMEVNYTRALTETQTAISCGNCQTILTLQETQHPKS